MEPATAVVESPAQAPSLQTPPVDPKTPEPQEKNSLQQAVEKGDTRTYKQERNKQRVAQHEGKPYTPPPAKPAASTEVTPKTAASAPAAPEKPKGQALSKRTDDLKAENAELQNQLRIRAELRKQLQATEPAPKAAATPPANEATKAAWQRYKDLPDAPKAEQFEHYEDYLDARADFIAERRVEERFAAHEQQAQQRTQFESSVSTYESQVDRYRTSVLEWQKTNPDAQFDPDFMRIDTMSAIQLRNALAPPDQQEPIGPHHFIVDQVFRSETPGPLSAYFSQHPQQFKALCDLAVSGPDGPAMVMRRIGQLEAGFLHAPASPAPSPSARTPQPPPPPTTLGRKTSHVLNPLEAAMKSGNTGDYKRLRREQRMASLTR